MPPPSKRVRTVDDEGVEQLQPTALDSEEATTTGEGEQEHVLWCTFTHVQLYLNHIPTHVCLPLTNPNYVCGYIHICVH